MRVAPNIYKNASGTYRARKMMNGTSLTMNFSNLSIAKQWIKAVSL